MATKTQSTQKKQNRARPGPSLLSVSHFVFLCFCGQSDLSLVKSPGGQRHVVVACNRPWKKRTEIEPQKHKSHKKTEACATGSISLIRFVFCVFVFLWPIRLSLPRSSGGQRHVAVACDGPWKKKAKRGPQKHKLHKRSRSRRGRVLLAYPFRILCFCVSVANPVFLFPKAQAVSAMSR